MGDRDEPSQLPGKGLFGWLGRQVGHVRAAVRHDPMTVAKQTCVDEKRDPAHPGVVFRRTVVDEVRREERGLPDAPADDVKEEVTDRPSR